MAKKKRKAQQPVAPDTVITLTLPGQGGLLRTATVTAQRGKRAVVTQFDYADQAGIATGIAQALAELQRVLELEIPAITTTEEDEYRPDLENKRAELQPGVYVKTPDGYGEVLEAANEDDSVLVALADEQATAPVYYPVSELTITARPDAVDDTTDPAQQAGDTSKLHQPVHTSHSPESEQQLALF